MQTHTQTRAQALTSHPSAWYTPLAGPVRYRPAKPARPPAAKITRNSTAAKERERDESAHQEQSACANTQRYLHIKWRTSVILMECGSIRNGQPNCACGRSQCRSVFARVPPPRSRFVPTYPVPNPARGCGITIYMRETYIPN